MSSRLVSRWRYFTYILKLARWPLGVGLLTRLAYWIFASPQWVANSDADQYLQIARNLAHGDGFSLIFPQMELHATAFRPPVYPAILSIPASLFGDDILWPSRLLSVIIALGVILLTVLFVKRVSSEVAAICSGLCVALYPPLIANDTVTLSEPIGLLLLLALLIALDARMPIRTGFLVGLLLLTRPNAYLVVLIVAFALWNYVGPKKMALSMVVCGLTVIPWLVRNQVQIGSFRLTTSEGFNLAALYSFQAQQQGGFVDPVFHESFGDLDIRLSQFDEAKWNSKLTSIGLEGMRSNPSYVLEMVKRNVHRFFELTPSKNDSPESIDGRNLTVRHWTLPLFYLVTIGGLGGLWLERRNRAMWPAVVMVAQFSALSLVLITVPRLRGPFDLLMCIGIGLLAGRLVQQRAECMGSGSGSWFDDRDGPAESVVRSGQRGNPRFR